MLRTTVFMNSIHCPDVCNPIQRHAQPIQRDNSTQRPAPYTNGTYPKERDRAASSLFSLFHLCSIQNHNPGLPKSLCHLFTKKNSCHLGNQSLQHRSAHPHVPPYQVSAIYCPSAFFPSQNCTAVSKSKFPLSIATSISAVSTPSPIPLLLPQTKMRPSC